MIEKKRCDEFNLSKKPPIVKIQILAVGLFSLSKKYYDFRKKDLTKRIILVILIKEIIIITNLKGESP